MGIVTLDEELLFDLLGDMEEFDKTWKQKKKKIMKKLGWTRQRMEYHLQKRKASEKIGFAT